MIPTNIVIPAQAAVRRIGILQQRHNVEIPACAGMTLSPVTPALTVVPPLPVIPAQAAVRRIGILQRCRSTKNLAGAALMLILTILTGNAHALDLRGHAKLQATSSNLPSDSLLRDFSDDPMSDTGFDLRLNLDQRRGNWSWRADYQLLARQGDRYQLQQQTSLTGFDDAALAEDDLRLFDLTHRISQHSDAAISHRFDRLYLSHSTDKTVVNFGRQAISWGNGLFYNPVDFFNPFDPAAIDTEYKTGDDMLYAQYLTDSGDDLQAVWVIRRDADGEVAADRSSLAFKYHGFLGRAEFDLLLAEHYDTRILAVGGLTDIAEAIWRGDIIVADTSGESFASAVLNWSYSWIAWDKNLSANVEYFHNGFGIDDADYGPLALADNPQLEQRLQRGELFTLGSNYLAAALSVELAPLWIMTTNLFRNLDDDSLLLQIFSQHDLSQDWQLLMVLTLPQGDKGSEFGGIESGVAGRSLAVGETLFVQLAWYF